MHRQCNYHKREYKIYICSYVVNENSIFIPKANWKITKSELEGAVKMLQNPSFAKNAAIGSSYVYAIIFNALEEIQ